MQYTVLNRKVEQVAPRKYEQQASYLDYDILTTLLSKSGLRWEDILYVYQFVERRLTRKKCVDVVSVYLQGKPGSMDYKYVDGLDFLVPVRNVYKEMMNFMEGGDIG